MHQTYLVLKYIAEDNTVLLLNEKQEKVAWNPAHTTWKTALYKRSDTDIAENDRLVATDRMRHLDIENGHRLSVKKLGKKSAEFLNESSGKTVKLKYSDLHNSSFRHAYASTVLGAERVRKSHVIADVKGFAATKEMFDELSVRATRSIDILTDNEERFVQQAERAEMKLDATASLMIALKEVPELQKFIDANTIRDFENNLNEITTQLAQTFKGVDQRTLAQKSIDFVVARLGS